MAKKPATGASPALQKALTKVESKISGKYVWGLPHYSLDSKLKLELVVLGDMDLFEENEVDVDEVGPWVPLGLFKDEPQFLAVSTTPPFAVGMWEHEDGKIYPVWESLDALAKVALAKKSEKTPFEKLAKDIEKASKLIDAGKKPQALKLLEPVIATMPKAIPNRPFEDDDQARAWNLYGVALEDAKRLPEAKAAYERAIAAGDDYASLNLLDMFEEAGDPQAVLDAGLPLRERGIWDSYVKIWLARYLAVAYAGLGKAKEAEAELVNTVEEYGINEADKLQKARDSLVEYIGKDKRGAKLLAQWVDAFKPHSYEVTPAVAKANRAWWKKLQPGLRKKLLEELNKETEDTDAASDEDIARTRDVDSIHLDEDDGTFDHVAVFLDFPRLERLGFYGDPDSIEPLRKLSKVTLTINNDVIKEFEWPSRADRDYLKAAEKGDKKAVEKAIAAGANIHARGDFGRNAVHLARDKPALAKWLVEQGVDPWAGTHGDGCEVGSADDTYAAEAKKAGIPHPDLDVWREFGCGRESAHATFEFDSELELEDGESLTGKFPKDAKLKMEPPKKDNKLYDLHSVKYRGLVASERLAERLRGPGVELFPVTIVDHAGKVRPEKYFFVNPLQIDCLIPEKSFPQWNHIDRDSMSNLAAFAIDPKKVGDAKLFRLGLFNSHPAIIATSLADTLKDFTGLRIEYTRR